MNPTPEALERLGDHLWHAAVDLLFLDSPESEPEAWRLNSNRQMAAWCQHLGLENPSGATFEIHVAQCFLEGGFPAVQAVLHYVRDLEPKHPVNGKVLWGVKDGITRRLGSYANNKKKAYEAMGWACYYLPVGERPPSMFDVER